MSILVCSTARRNDEQMQFFDNAAEISKKRGERQTMEFLVDESLLEEHAGAEVDDDQAQWDVEDIDGDKDSRSEVDSSPKKLLQSSTASDSELQVCPVCSKRLRVDNAGLNEHIDYCLSKGTIMDATMEAPTRARDIEGSLTKTKRSRHYLDSIGAEDGTRGRLKRPKAVK